MNCRTARANFSSYVEQELSELERRAVAAHLGRCARCSSDLFTMQKAISLLRWVPRPEARPEFTDRLWARIRAEERSPRTPSRAGLWLDELRDRCRGLGVLLATPAPAGALVAALVIGVGGGALVTGMRPAFFGAGDLAVVGSPGGTTPGAVSHVPPGLPVPNPSPVTSEALTASSGATSAETATGAGTPGMSAGAATGGAAVMVALPTSRAAAARHPIRTSDNSPASEPGTSRVRSRRVAPRGTNLPAVEVADWASGGKRLEELPEGPPAVARVEYVLDLVDVNRKPVATTARVQAREGTITF